MSFDLPGGQRRDLYDCPVNLVPAKLERYLRHFPAWRAHGTLYAPGAYCAQPARHMRALGIIGDEVGRIEEADRQRDKARSSTTAGAAWARRH